MDVDTTNNGAAQRRRRRAAVTAASPDDRERLTADLARHIARRERTCREAIDYLVRRGYRADLVEEAVNMAVAQGLIDDRRYADMYVRDRRRLRPMSRWALVKELEQKGVGPDAAEEAVAASEPPWDDLTMALEALSGRYRRWPADSRWRKASGFLQRRGFSGAIIRAALERAVAQDEDSSDSAEGYTRGR